VTGDNRSAQTKTCPSGALSTTNQLTGDNRSAQTKTCPSGALSTTNPTQTELGLKSGLPSDRPATNRLSHGTAFFWLQKCHYCLTENTVLLHYKEQLVDAVNGNGRNLL
jgi:hypothetical protein